MLFANTFLVRRSSITPCAAAPLRAAALQARAAFGEAMEQNPGWLWMILVFFGVLYVGAPLGTYFKLRQSAEPKPLRLDPNQTPLPEAVGYYFDKVENALASIGFERVDDLALPRQVPNVAANLRLFVNREQGDSASCTAVYVKAGSTWRMKVQYVQFLTFFRDEMVYATSNSGVLSSFPPRPQSHNNRFPKVRNPIRLYEIHQGIIRDESRMQKKTVPLIDEFHGDGVAYQRWSLKRELEDAANAGCLHLDEARQIYRPTLVGAFTMTWKLLWPWKLIQLMQRKRNSARILAELRRTAG
jgi:hypothetical protein